MTHLLLTVRFLDNRYHGLLGDEGPAEWPPSPFRLFCALVAGLAKRSELEADTGKALAWLQTLGPPAIVAPKTKKGQPITQYVPNNDGDELPDRQDRLGTKPTVPTLFLLEPDQKAEVHYVWDLPGKGDCPITYIRRAARSVAALGWGIDVAFADARQATIGEIAALKGIRWYPKKNAGSFRDTLRVPTYDAETGESTLSDLRHCHSTFLNRIEDGQPLRMVDKPSVFERVLYTSVERPVGRPYRVFRIECDDEVGRFTYPQSKLIHIAGIVRHLAIETMKKNPPSDLRGWTPDGWVDSYVAGHQSKVNKDSGTPHTQFSYIPLQSIGNPNTDPGVRRVMIVAPVADDAWLEHLAARLDGALLVPQPGTKLPAGTRLERIDDRRTDGVRDGYVRASIKWASVTPVILPGHDDRKPAKTRSLILKALQQSGIEQSCTFEWSAFSLFRKMLPAHKYRKNPNDPSKKMLINYIRPDHLLDQTAVHVTLTFANGLEVPGPLTLGAGRHCGFGLMAAIK